MGILNVARARSVLLGQELDALVATSPENFYYLSEIEHPSLLNAGLPAGAVMSAPNAEVVALILPQVSAGWALDLRDSIPYICFYGELGFTQEAGSLRREERSVVEMLTDPELNAADFHSALIRCVQKMGLTSGRIGFDDTGIAAMIADRLPELDAQEADDIFHTIRYVKSEDEIARLREAASAAELVESDLIQQIATDIPWTDLNKTYRLKTAEYGAENGFLSGGGGWRSAFIYPPTDRSFRPGDIIRLDLGLRVRRYWADTGRTAVIGEPKTEVRRRYEALRTGQQGMLDEIRPGVSLAHLYETGMRLIREGIPDYERHHCGHTIGLQASDGEKVAPTNKRQLEPGVVLNIEVPLFALGWGGMQIEDTVVVSAQGFDLLTGMSRELLVID